MCIWRLERIPIHLSLQKQATAKCTPGEVAYSTYLYKMTPQCVPCIRRHCLALPHVTILLTSLLMYTAAIAG